MDPKKNDKRYVSTVRGLEGGYLFRAPVGTALPKDIATALTADWKCLGYVGEDGWTESVDMSSETIKDMNAEVVDTYFSEITETIAVPLMDMAPAAFETEYGSANVSSADGLIKVNHDWTKLDETFSYVMELVLKNGRRWRKVIPAAKVTEVGEFQGNASTPSGREVTITYTEKCYDLYEDIDAAKDGE